MHNSHCACETFLNAMSAALNTQIVDKEIAIDVRW